MEAARSSERSPMVTKALSEIDCQEETKMITGRLPATQIFVIVVPSRDKLPDHLLA